MLRSSGLVVALDPIANALTYALIMPLRPATPADVPLILPMIDALLSHHVAEDPDRFATLPDVLDR